MANPSRDSATPPETHAGPLLETIAIALAILVVLSVAVVGVVSFTPADPPQ